MDNYRMTMCVLRVQVFLFSFVQFLFKSYFGYCSRNTQCDLERGSFDSLMVYCSPAENGGICKANLIPISYDETMYCIRSVAVFTCYPHRTYPLA